MMDELQIPEIPEKEIVIQTDRRSVHQILLNLTTNAIKFTKHGSVRLQLSERDAEGRKLVEFRVIDTGIGIRTEDRNPYFRIAL